MKVLVLGSGGREHALAWRIAQTAGMPSVFLHPGNAGTRRAGYATLGEGELKTPEAVGARAKELGVELIVIGPEALLADGYGDSLRGQGFLVVGPNASAARLETSKVFAKEFMARHGIPTARFHVVDRPAALITAAASFPVVLKLDGLAAGKGVVVAQSAADVKDFAKRIWEDHEFGCGHHRVVVEDFIPGRELSYMGLCDGKAFLALPSATDYKRVGDGDRGPNTGGMGAVSPSPYLTPALDAVIRQKIVTPVLAGLEADGLDYRGVLYVGVMVAADGSPHVLEFNTRFGDPETQAVLMRLRGDFAALLARTASGRLVGTAPPAAATEAAVYVVAAAEGYPAKPVTGDPIRGLDDVPRGSEVFFSGVQTRDGELATAGGRVLGVGCLAPSIRQAREGAYAALGAIVWRGMHFRRDIGQTFA